MAAPTTEPPIHDRITTDRLAAWVDQNDHIFRGHRSRLAAAAPKLATLIATPNPFVPEHCLLLAEVAVDRGDDPVDVLVSETTLSREEIDQIAETVSGYADTHWVEILSVLGRNTYTKREVIERIAAINPQHIGADWHEHPDELYSLLDTCPTLVLPDTVEEWDVLYRYWNPRGPLEKDRYRNPTLWYLIQFQTLYAQRYPGISFEDMDAMLGESDLNRVWGYCKFVSKLMDSDGKPNEAERPCVPFLSQFEPAELVKQADVCHTEMVRISNQALSTQGETFQDWPRLIQDDFKSNYRTAVSLVTPAELMREAAMLFEFVFDDFHELFLRGDWHLVAIKSPEGVHLSTAEFFSFTEAGNTDVIFVHHLDIDGNIPTPDCEACVRTLEEHLEHPTQKTRVVELVKRFAEPDQAMRIMLAQFKLKSAALGAEALSAVMSNQFGNTARRADTPVPVGAWT